MRVQPRFADHFPRVPGAPWAPWAGSIEALEALTKGLLPTTTNLSRVQCGSSGCCAMGAPWWFYDVEHELNMVDGGYNILWSYHQYHPVVPSWWYCYDNMVDDRDMAWLPSCLLDIYSWWNLWPENLGLRPCATRHFWHLGVNDGLIHRWDGDEHSNRKAPMEVAM